MRWGAYSTLLLACALRFHGLEAQSLWSDEGNSMALAQASFQEIARRTAFDIHPPLYYWLLKIWTSFLGNSEFALRSLSAFAGLGLVALIYRLGWQIFNRRVGLAAAFVAALSPFQVYYAQEARMYMLLTLLGALAFWCSLTIWQHEQEHENMGGPPLLTLYLLYTLIAISGLYTHYAFPLVLVIINLGAFCVNKISPPDPPKRGKMSAIPSSGGSGGLEKPRFPLKWLSWQITPLLGYLPWLPIAYRQITTWPQLMTQTTWPDIGLTLMQHLSLGLSAEGVNAWWLLVFGGGVMIGIWGSHVDKGIKISSPSRGLGGRKAITNLTPSGHVRQRNGVWLILLWLILPVGWTAYLFRPAYLKFLLVASPAFCLLLGRGISGLGLGLVGRISRLVLIVLVTISSCLSLQAAFNDSRFQRDNYRAMAAFIEGVATADDAVIIHAPGQQEVFGYYYHPEKNKASVYPLPQQRPLDVSATLATLEALSKQADRIFGLFWATQEADPQGVIESWLEQHTFKAHDVWFGHVRLVSYATPLDVGAVDLSAALPQSEIHFEEGITLLGYHLTQTSLEPGQILRVVLQWQTQIPLTKNYTVFLQLLDEAHHLVGQRDAMSLVPTKDWSPQQPISDQHGLFVEPGSPPGSVRLIMGLYDATTGARLPLVGSAQNFVELARLNLISNRLPLSPAVFQMQYPHQPPPLLGYDLYKLGHLASDAPFHPGDPLHLVLYWQRPQTLPQNDRLTIQLLDLTDHALKGNVVTQWQAPVAGVDYPMWQWQPDEIVRAQFTFFLGGIRPGRYRLALVLEDQAIFQTHQFWVVSQ